ncbi:MAG: alpha/beta hydrolase [Pirellulaceae bacterium]
MSDEGNSDARSIGATASSPARSRQRWRQLVKRVGVVAVAYLLVVFGTMWCETLLIFPTWQIPAGDWNPTGFSYEDVFFHAEDGTRLNGWYFAHPDPRAHVLYCHGNGEHLAHLGDYMDGLREEYQVSIFAFDYRGYGRSEGKPHEAGVIADARAARAWLAQHARIEPEEVVLWGRSIGGAVAVAVGADGGARGMILERTFTRLTDVAARHYWWLPVRLLMRNRFDSLSRISAYHGPLLQSHGTEDEIVPLSLGKALFEAAGSRDKQFVTMPKVTHNGPSSKEYHAELNRFLKRL